MNDINETINEIQTATRTLLNSDIDSTTMDKINKELENVKTKILNNLENYNRRFEEQLEEQEKLYVKEQYVNSLKKDIFSMLNNHVPIGSYIYDSNYEEVQLTPEQQIALYENVFQQLNIMLEEARGNSIKNDLISELALAIYTWGSSKLSHVSSNLTNKSLELSSKTIAVVASIEFLYNYLPDGTRTSLESIPHIGSMFKIANHIRPVVIGVQNTAAVSASIYMALKSGGIDPQPFVNDVLSSCQRTSKTIGETIGQRMIEKVSGFCSDILSMFQVNFNDSIRIDFTPSPEQIPLLSYASYNQSQIILQEQPEQSASAIANNLDLLITQLNEKLRQTQEVEQLYSSLSSDDEYGTGKRGRSDEYNSSKRLRVDDNDEELTGGRRRTKRRRTKRRRTTKKRGGYRKRKHTNHRRHRKSKRHYRR
jgi:hypothetical protein